MKITIVLTLAAALTLQAQDTTMTPPPVADESAAHQGYPPIRYQDLWTKSPFAVETPDEGVTESADYALVGVAQLGDVTYASLIDKHSQNHLLVSSDKPLGNLSLSSVTKKPDGVYATLTRNGEILTLKLEVATATGSMPAPMQPNAPAPMPAASQNIPMPGSFNPSSARPFIRIRRSPIHLPPRTYNDQPTGQAPGQPPPPPTPAQ